VLLRVATEISIAATEKIATQFLFGSEILSAGDLLYVWC
jgi:hypothetical protein